MDKEQVTSAGMNVHILQLLTEPRQKVSVTSVVDDWIKFYRENPENALVEFKKFILESCGSKTTNVDIDSISFEKTDDYPLKPGPGKTALYLKLRFCDFIRNLILHCQYTFLYDNMFVPSALVFLTKLTKSQYLNYRYTSTLAVMTMTEALVDVAVATSCSLERTIRQCDIELKKESKDQSIIDPLELNKHELSGNLELIKSYLKSSYAEVLYHRYRDISVDIQKLCSTAATTWMKKFPDYFLTDFFLDHIGRGIREHECPLRCLQIIAPMFEERFKEQLRTFTCRYLSDIICLTSRRIEIAIQAVKLLIKILDLYSAETFDKKECESINQLIFATNQELAKLSATFFGKCNLKELEEPKAFLRMLINFCDDKRLAPYLVDAFLGINPIVQNFKSMTDLILKDPDDKEEPLLYQQESVLIEIMGNSVVQCCTGPPELRKNSKSKRLNEQTIEENMTNITEHFIIVIPDILQKYSADTEIIKTLLTIPQFFKLEMYTTLRQETYLQKLLDKIALIMDISTDNEVLENCSKTLEHLCSEGTSVYAISHFARGNLIDSCVNKYKQAVQDFSLDKHSEDETYAQNISLKYISILYHRHDLNPWNLFDSLFSKVQGLPFEGFGYCIESCTFSIIWDFLYIEKMCEPDILNTKLDELHTKLNTFLKVCFLLVANGETTEIKECSSLAICDLLCIFSDQLLDNDKLKYFCGRKDIEILGDFIEKFVFSSENDISKDRRRKLLSQFCKLTIYNVVPGVVAAARIYIHFHTFYDDFGDIIEATLIKLRKMNTTNYPLIMVFTLKTMFEELNPTHSNELSELEATAKRLSKTFGSDRNDCRVEIPALIKFGITYARHNILFLKVLKEFHTKLLPCDRVHILNFVQKQIPTQSGVDNQENQKVLTEYGRNLQFEDSENSD